MRFSLQYLLQDFFLIKHSFSWIDTTMAMWYKMGFEMLSPLTLSAWSTSITCPWSLNVAKYIHRISNMDIKGHLFLFAMPSYHAQLVGFTREWKNLCCDVRFLPGRLSMLSSHDFLTDNASSAMKINILFFTSSLYLHFLFIRSIM